MALWARVLYKYGVPSAIALFLVWVVATQLLAAVRDIQSSLQRVESGIHDHSFQTNFYMRAMCVNTAVQAGKPPAVCDPPFDPIRR